MPSLYNIFLLSSGSNGRLDPVSASQFNFISNNAGSVILGSNTNRMCGDNSSILAGQNNLITGITTPGAEILGANLIGGGSDNCIIKAGSAVLGSSSTCLEGINSTIIASTYTLVRGNNSLSVGNSNTICGDADSILGGTNNVIKGRVSSIMGGNGNSIDSVCNSIIGGGYFNKIDAACFGFLGGGAGNCVGGIGSSVVGGDANYATCILSFLGGGRYNVASACFSVVGGGLNNQAGPGTGNFTMDKYQVVVGGNFNKAVCDGSFVGGGFANHASGCYSSVLGGRSNCISVNACDSFIIGNNGNSIHSGAGLITDGQNRVHNSSGPHTLTLDFASGVFIKNKTILQNSYIPSAENSAGTSGQFAFDSNYFYYCRDTNDWVRTALSKW
jgi:hypothetical protein